ncbi:hypothetical protein QNI16_21490 [Cytophagaceae bacterium YF14B1]|uniref:Uncharacterized protein n=1 Tax=Xanthocytophaga flava TaxID=3048013 RepID=A0AAE3QPI1_9BACT|nr:hypothetical protein [Xanthocytophaga flavus]MDJ1483087.1 hypothetical protein [Xanthocytophaga flavus]
MKTILIIGVYILCILKQDEQPTPMSNKQKYEKQLEGNWDLTPKTQMIATKLIFHKNELVVDNRIDTIYRFSYIVNKDILLLRTSKSTLFKYKIRKLTADTLIFEKFLHSKHPSLYTRVKK